MKKLAIYLILALAFTPFVLAVWWLLWQLWLWVIPQVWASAPMNVLSPSYWLFVGCLFLIGFIGNLLRGKA